MSERDDALEQRLRETLGARADDVSPSAAGWATIQDRVDGPGRRWWVPVLALGTATALVAGVVAFVGDGESPEIVAGPGASPTTSEATAGGDPGDPLPDTRFPGIWPEFTWEGYEATAAAVHDGSQPWRLEPVEVVRAYLAERWGEREVGFYEEDGPDGRCSDVPFEIRSAPEVELGFATVCAVGDADPSPYVVVAVGNQRFQSAAWDFAAPLEVRVRTEVPGTLTVRAGAFASEWAGEKAQAVREVGPGRPGTFASTLEVGDRLPDPTLVQVVHRAADGSEAFAEYRIDSRYERPARLCGEDPGSGDQSGPHEALRQELAETIGEEQEVDIETGRRTMVRLQATVIGEDPRLSDGPGRPVVGWSFCLLHVWGDVESGAPEGVSAIDFIRTSKGADGWYPSNWSTKRVMPTHEFASVEVAMLRADAECGKADSEFVMMKAHWPLWDPTARDPGLFAVQQLVTGFPADRSVRTAIPVQAWVRDVRIEDGVAHVDFSDGILANNSSCEGNAKVEQIRRTLLARPGVDDVVITVNGEAADLVG